MGRIVQHIGHGAAVAIRCGRLCTHRRTITLWTPSPPSPTGPVAAAAVVQPDGSIERWGDTTEPFAGIGHQTVTAMTVLIAHEEGTSISTSRSGDSTTATCSPTPPGSPDTSTNRTTRTRRIYSTSAYDLAANAVTERSGIAFQDYLDEALTIPLGLHATHLNGSAGAGARASVDDLVRVIDAWRRPFSSVRPPWSRPSSHLPDLDGVLPDSAPNARTHGVSTEIRGHKDPHWTAAITAPTPTATSGRQARC